MTWTYNSDFTTSRDQIRREVADVDTTDQLLSDEEITQSYSAEGNVISAAARCAEWLAAKFARKATSAVGDLRINYSDLFKHYNDLARGLRQKGQTYAIPYAGGISVDRQNTIADDTDRVEPGFKVGMLTNPETTPSDTRELP